MIWRVLRLASCRFAAIYFIAYAAGALGNGADLLWIVLGAPYWLVFSLATELINRLSDRVEDSINRPERTALCDAVGWDRIRRLAIVAWSVVLVCDVAWVLARPSVPLAALLFVAAFASINYSYGLRLKRTGFFSLLVITFPFCGTFFVGWAVNAGAAGAGDALLDRYLPFALFLGWFVGTLAGVKDITDALGDAEVGYRSLFLSLARRHPLFLLAAILAIPFAFLWAFIATGWLEERFVWLTVFWPASAIVALCALRAETADEREATRELAYQYWLVFLSAAFVTFEPSPTMVAVDAAALVYWIATSQLVHWSGGVQRWKLAVVPRLLVRPTSSRDREVAS
jgi:4-hydroxybenzoate polyprenyltransferase